MNPHLDDTRRARWSRRQLLGSGAAAMLATQINPLAAQSPTNSAAQSAAQSQRSSQTMPIIDVHAHSQVPAWEAAWREANLPARPAWSAEETIAKMDTYGLSTMFLSVPTPITFAGPKAKALARAINEEHAAIKAKYPGRIGAYTVLPGVDNDANLEEMAYALDVLKLDGVCTSTNIDGVYMGDARLDPWFEEMNRRATTLFIHPNLPVAPVNVGSHVSIVEFMADATRMIMNLVYSGAKSRFSDIKMIATHGGGTVPYLAQRLAWLQLQYGPGEGRKKLSEDEVMAGLQSFYYDLTAATSPAQLDAMLHLVPHTQLLMGFDIPYMSESFIEPAKAQFFAYENLNDQQKKDICETNPRALFPSFFGTGL